MLEEFGLACVTLDASHVVARPRVMKCNANAVDRRRPLRWQRFQERNGTRRQVPARHIDTLVRRPAIVIAANTANLALAEQRQRFSGKHAVVDQVAAADDLLDAELVDLHESVAQRVYVRVDISDDSELHVSVSLLAEMALANGRGRLPSATTYSIRRDESPTLRRFLVAAHRAAPSRTYRARNRRVA